MSIITGILLFHFAPWGLIITLVLTLVLLSALSAIFICSMVAFAWLTDPKRKHKTQAVLFAGAALWALVINVPAAVDYLIDAAAGAFFGYLLLTIFDILRSFNRGNWLVLAGIAAVVITTGIWISENPQLPAPIVPAAAPPVKMSIAAPISAAPSIFDAPPAPPAPVLTPCKTWDDPECEFNKSHALAHQTGFDMDDISGDWQPMRPASARSQSILEAMHRAAGVEP